MPRIAPVDVAGVVYLVMSGGSRDSESSGNRAIERVPSSDWMGSERGDVDCKSGTASTVPIEGKLVESALVAELWVR